YTHSTHGPTEQMHVDTRHYSSHATIPTLSFFFKCPDHHRDLHSFPTRRSSDLANGYYLFSNLGAGTYRVREEQQAGWTQTTPNPAEEPMASGTTPTGHDCGNLRYDKITGYKFAGLNGNGSREPGERAVANSDVS